MSSESVPLAEAELAEAEFMYQYVANTPEPARSELGVSTRRIGGGVALSMRNDPSGYWSKAIGFGYTEPVTADLVENLIDFYTTEDNARAVIQIAPACLPGDWPDICAKHHLRAGNRQVKLGCAVEDFIDGQTRLRVGPVGHDDAARWASAVLRGLGWPEQGLSDMYVATVDNPLFRSFAVWDGDDIVAGANLLIHGNVGSFNSGATLPSHRNLGAQTALLTIRAREAVAAGCRFLVAESGKPAAGATNSSLNNMRRAGLRVLYTRQNWIWEAAEHGN